MFYNSIFLEHSVRVCQEQIGLAGALCLRLSVYVWAGGVDFTGFSGFTELHYSTVVP